MAAIDEYFEALERLKNNKPERVPKGTKITNDAVAIEAGRKKGSIKKSREIFTDLIITIDEASQKQNKPKLDEKAKLEKAKNKAENYRSLYEAALSRELMLIRENAELKKELLKLKEAKVVKI